MSVAIIHHLWNKCLGNPKKKKCKSNQKLAKIPICRAKRFLRIMRNWIRNFWLTKISKLSTFLLIKIGSFCVVSVYFSKLGRIKIKTISKARLINFVLQQETTLIRLVLKKIRLHKTNFPNSFKTQVWNRPTASARISVMVIWLPVIVQNVNMNGFISHAWV